VEQDGAHARFSSRLIDALTFLARASHASKVVVCKPLIMLLYKK
jgi:hypothetical protein